MITNSTKSTESTTNGIIYSSRFFSRPTSALRIEKKIDKTHGDKITNSSGNRIEMVIFIDRIPSFAFLRDNHSSDC